MTKGSVIVAATALVVAVIVVIALRTPTRNIKNVASPLEYTKSLVKSVSDFWLDFDEEYYPRILCWVEVHTRTHVPKLKAVNETWGRRCDSLIFMGSDNVQDTKLRDIMTVVVSPKDGSPWQLTQSYLSHLYNNYLDKYDWFLNTDENTYLVVGNLRYLLTAYDPDEPVSIGSRNRAAYDHTIQCLGHVMSRAALASLVEVGFTRSVCPSRLDKRADLKYELGVCMAKSNISVGESRDEFGRERIFCSPANNQIRIKMDATGDPSGKTSVETLSKTTISFRGILSEFQMYAYEFFIYRLKLFQFYQPFEGSVPAPLLIDTTEEA